MHEINFLNAAIGPLKVLLEVVTIQKFPIFLIFFLILPREHRKFSLLGPGGSLNPYNSSDSELYGITILFAFVAV